MTIFLLVFLLGSRITRMQCGVINSANHRNACDQDQRSTNKYIRSLFRHVREYLECRDSLRILSCPSHRHSYVSYLKRFSRVLALAHHRPSLFSFHLLLSYLRRRRLRRLLNNRQKVHSTETAYPTSLRSIAYA